MELSEVSLFIDAAYTPAKTTSRRWLQVCPIGSIVISISYLLSTGYAVS